MKSCVTISLVSSLRGGPWILWDDLATSCRKAADLGFDAVELFTEGPSAGQRGELTAMLAETGLSLGSVGTGAGKVIRGLTLTDPDEGTRTKARAFVSDMIAFGAQHKAPAIIGSMQGNYGRETSREQALAWLGEALEELGEVAANAEVKLIYEPLNRYETNMFNRFSEAAEFLDGLNTQGVTMLADLFHMNIEEADVAETLREGARYVGHVHFADSNRRPVGNGHTAMEPIADVLREIGYDGCISAEAFDWPDPDAAARQTIDSYRKYFG
jgi:sugar phosphate isomerase/epimerase